MELFTEKKSPYLSTFVHSVDKKLKKFELFFLRILVCHSCKKVSTVGSKFTYKTGKKIKRDAVIHGSLLFTCREDLQRGEI